MSTNDRRPSPDTQNGDTLFSDSVVDAALRTYRDSREICPEPPDLTDNIMRQIREYRQGVRSDQSVEARRFMALVTGRPDLQSKLVGTGTLADLVWQVQRVAREGGLMLPKSAAYALISRPAAPRGTDELSDEELDAVSAAGGPGSFGIELGSPSPNGEYSWAFNLNGWKP
jgi:hypothetical protein